MTKEEMEDHEYEQLEIQTIDGETTVEKEV